MGFEAGGGGGGAKNMAQWGPGKKILGVKGASPK